MKSKAPGFVTFCAAITFTLLIPFNQGYSQTSKTLAFNGLTPAEQELLNEINQARANPQVYAVHLEKLKPQFNGKEYTVGTTSFTTQEGWNAVQEAIAFMRAAKPLGPLSTSKGLSLAAMWHCREQGGAGTTGHRSGNGGGLIEDRVKSFGKWQGGIGENLSYGTENARERLLTWLIDDGFASRGHRKRIMSAEYGVAGLSCGPHPQFGGMCVLALAGGFTDTPGAPESNKAVITNGTTSGTASVNTASTPASNKSVSTKTNSKPAKGKAKKS